VNNVALPGQLTPGVVVPAVVWYVENKNKQINKTSSWADLFCLEDKVLFIKSI
jgi:hypothetical protein